MGKVWLKGDTHLHTTNSDGDLPFVELIERCRKLNMDFIMITDHNYNTINASHFDKDMLIIQGQEITGYLGHTNIWGTKVPEEPPYNLGTKEDYMALVEKCREAGATISINHPFCTNCPYRMSIDESDFDCVEVWNTIQHSDNMKCRNWWVGELLKGRHIPVVGGSDFHREYVIIPFLASPTTYVLSEGKNADDILKAIREGRSVITNSADSGMVYLTSGEANIGDTITLDENSYVDIKVMKLRPKHTVTVYNNEKVILKHTAEEAEEEFVGKAKIKEKGFVRAEVTYRFNPSNRHLVALAEYIFFKFKKIENVKMLKELPDFIWAMTNPIWVE